MVYPTLKSEKIFEGKVFNIRIDEVRKPTGATMRIDLVEHSGAVVLIPMESDGSIILVRQYRHPTGQELIEFPAGTLDPGENPEDCAVRECREEVGMAPGRIQHLGGLFVAPGYSTEYLEVYLVTELTPAPLPQDPDEDITLEHLSVEEILAKIMTGEIQDAKTLAGTLLLKQHLQHE